MLPVVKTKIQKLEQYQKLIPSDLFEEIKSLADELKGLKVFHVNSSPKGGGVAEILESLVPLMKSVGIKTEWYTIPPKNTFFDITKNIHNALQGNKYNFSSASKREYMSHISSTANLMKEMKPDIWIIHDPQPAGVIFFLPELNPSICRLHIDLTAPDYEVWKFVSSFLKDYNKVIVSSSEFIQKEIEDKAVVFQPAINPFKSKNRIASLETSNQIIKKFGINPNKPLISQVSRFDPWKDPLGVVKAYQIAKKKFLNLQLALVGFLIAQDDPEAKKIYQEVQRVTKKDPDIFLFADLSKLGSLEIDVFVNAIQTASDIILQKSIREGFGMTVTEAMWKEKPVVAGNVGGIKLQIKNNKNGFLVSTPKETAEKIICLIENSNLSKKFGIEAKKTVQKNFLMPRLLRDYLKLFKEIVKKRTV